MRTFASDPQHAVEYYHEQGYWIEPNVWSQDECSALRATARSWPTWLDGTCAPAMNPHRWDPLILQALRNSRIVNFMRRVLGNDVSGLQTQYFFCRPGTQGFALHQDNYYVEAKCDAFASAWSPLVDVSPNNGTLVIYPGTHREAILPVREIASTCDPGQDVNAHKQEAIVPECYRPKDVLVKAGDVLFIHGHLVHSSYRNESTDFRDVLLSTYLRSGEGFRPGFTAKREPVEINT